jgi:5-methylcytosine-specific restriction endonuclease McrA
VSDAVPPPASALRTCLRAPVPEIAQAALILDEAVSAHLAGNFARAAQLLSEADLQTVRAWTESLWGAKSKYAPKKRRDATAFQKQRERMPGAAVQLKLHARDGFHCRFCEIPVIRKAVRERIRHAYPNVQIWGRKNSEQHAALQAMWAQYDHVVPHSAGGGNDLDNIIVTCAPCNYARMDCTLEEAGLRDPRLRTPSSEAWDGLERFR